MSAAAIPRSLTAPAQIAARAHPATRVRVEAIDLLRGAVMVLMVLDHTRDFVTNARFDPLDLAQTSTALFFTRWVTHFCAPVFVFLAGTSAFLSGARRGDAAALARFLLSRGAWLVLLELTVVNFGWAFNARFESGVILQVIWAIGVAMIALAPLVFLPTWAVGAIGAAIVAGHNALDGVTPSGGGAAAAFWSLLHVSGPLSLGAVPVFALYPVLPWIGVMACGYAFGALFQLDPARRRLLTAAIGSNLLALFVVLRSAGGYGDPAPWTSDQPWLAFLKVTKYGPSLEYVGATLGPALLALAALDGARGPVARLLVTLGRVPLFFYVLHIYLVHAIALGLGAAQGFPVASLARDFRHLPDGYGVGLGGVYTAWIAAVVALAPLAHWFAGVKRRSTSGWMSYL
jgi:uncharacterized membrane protein